MELWCGNLICEENDELGKTIYIRLRAVDRNLGHGKKNIQIGTDLAMVVQLFRGYEIVYT